MGVSFDFKAGPWHRERRAILNDTSQSQIPRPPSPHSDNLLSTTQIWLLHSPLEIPNASSHPRNEVLGPLWTLQWPRYTFPALSSALLAMAAPTVPSSFSSPCVCTCCTLLFRVPFLPFPCLAHSSSTLNPRDLAQRTGSGGCKELPQPKHCHTCSTSVRCWAGLQSRDTGSFSLLSQCLAHSWCSVHIY